MHRQGVSGSLFYLCRSQGTLAFISRMKFRRAQWELEVFTGRRKRPTAHLRHLASKKAALVAYSDFVSRMLARTWWRL